MNSQASPGKVWPRLRGPRKKWVRVEWQREVGVGEWEWRCIPNEQLTPWTIQNKLCHHKIIYLYLESDVFSFEDRFCHIHQIQLVVYYILRGDFRVRVFEYFGNHLQLIYNYINLLFKYSVHNFIIIYALRKRFSCSLSFILRSIQTSPGGKHLLQMDTQSKSHPHTYSGHTHSYSRQLNLWYRTSTHWWTTPI